MNTIKQPDLGALITKLVGSGFEEVSVAEQGELIKMAPKTFTRDPPLDDMLVFAPKTGPSSPTPPPLYPSTPSEWGAAFISACARAPDTGCT